MARKETFAQLLDACAPGLSYQELAGLIGVSVRTLLTYRTRGTKRPHRLTVGAVSRGIGAPVRRVSDAIRATYAAAQAD
jgi:hypothetical protein